MSVCYTYRMLIIDAQSHLWPGAGSSPRHGSAPFLASDASAELDRFAAYATLVMGRAYANWHGWWPR